ncbi:hypothetical protein [Deinococcus apachensis]|uniref:hypothetical protein n=1 Tax=Deinococcus apachensis TaxID=309886 RepID=UPI0003823288|nr:hypothetical protein [Deinococcus apachensis]
MIGAPWNSWTIQELLDRVRAQAERARRRELDLQSWLFEREAIRQEWERGQESPRPR